MTQAAPTPDLIQILVCTADGAKFGNIVPAHLARLAYQQATRKAGKGDVVKAYPYNRPIPNALPAPDRTLWL
jgi:hypothetical protein